MTLNTILKDIHFTSLIPVTKKCITYAADGNTVIRPYKKLYSLERISEARELKNLYLEPVKCYYSMEYKIWEDFGPLCYCIGRSQEEIPLSIIIKRLREYGVGEENYIKRLADVEAAGGYIKQIDIDLLASLNKHELKEHYMVYRASYKEKLHQREEVERLARMEQEKREQEAAEKQEADAIDQAIRQLQAKRTVRNEDINGKSLILLLAKKYGVCIPIRTQGWIKKKLVMVEFSNGDLSYRYRGTSRKDDSKVFINYLNELVLAVNDPTRF